jgi:membrane-bound metal-dependent hydrolase YbcI (DUF457 family)
MITRHHITLSLLCVLTLAVAGVPGNPWQAGIFLAGAICGSMLPDIHMKKPSRPRFLTVAYYITRFSEHACMPVMKWLSEKLLKTPVASGEKRAAHSLAGLVFIAATIGVMAIIMVVIPGHPIDPVIAGTFFFGVVLGLLLHMIADMCTKKGIAPFYPFSNIQLSGTIRPCNPDDWRIAGYHAGLCIVLIVLVTLTNGGYPGTIRIMAAFIGLVACIGAMLYCSHVRVTRGESSSGTGTEVPGAVS